MATGYIGLNNKIVPAKKALVSAYDPGFLYGRGLFETMRAYNGRVFAIEQHLRRLFVSLPAVGIKLKLSPDRIIKAVYAALKANRLKDGYVRLTVWQAEKKADLSILVKKYQPYSDKIYSQGFSALVSSLRQNEFSPLASVKSTNYLLNLLAREEAEGRGFDEAILLNTRGAVCEGSRANIFLINKGRLMTPDLKQGCLGGITRKIVLELAQKKKIKTYEGKISLRQLLNSNEAFVTNSLMEIMPLSRVNNRKIGNGKPGEITLALRQSYKGLVNDEKR